MPYVVLSNPIRSPHCRCLYRSYLELAIAARACGRIYSHLLCDFTTPHSFHCSFFIAYRLSLTYMTTANPSNLIAAVESYLSPSLSVGTTISNDPSAPALHLIPSSTLTKLRNVGPARVKDMRTLGHSKQIVSHIAITATAQTCTKLNDTLYAAIRLNPEKFAALALLPSGEGDGKEAAKELQRCIIKYRFAGGVVGLRRGGGSLDDNSFEDLWFMAEKYRVPIALKEIWPAGSEVSRQSHSSRLRERRGERTDDQYSSSSTTSATSPTPSSDP